jgi:hypothetical protein
MNGALSSDFGREEMPVKRMSKRIFMGLVCGMLMVFCAGCADKPNVETGDRYVEQTIALNARISMANTQLMSANAKRPQQALVQLKQARQLIAEVTAERKKLDPPTRMKIDHNAMMELAGRVDAAFARAIDAAEAGDTQGIIRHRESIMNLGQGYVVAYQNIVRDQQPSQQGGTQ